MSMVVRSVMGAIVFGTLMIGGGCKSSYMADIRNQTPQPVVATLIDPVGPDQIVRLGPGDRGQLGPVMVDQKELVQVKVDSLGNTGVPAMFQLRPGENYLNVLQGGQLTSGPLMIREVPR
jgi:hypothetical protein